MMTVTPAIAKSMASSSWIRKMFEKGLELKREFGEDAVCDFSLGNPDVPPPSATAAALREIADNAVKPLGLGYCPNSGIPAVRSSHSSAPSSSPETRSSPRRRTLSSMGPTVDTSAGC